jgi:hypothetical protein
MGGKEAGGWKREALEVKAIAYLNFINAYVSIKLEIINRLK